MKGGIFVIWFRAVSIGKEGEVISARCQDAASGIESKEDTLGIIGDVNANTNGQEVLANFCGYGSAKWIISCSNEVKHEGLTMPA